MRPVRTSYVDRMVSVRDVSWVRAADGTYVVTWVEDDQPRVATFRTERAAIRMINYLDTSGAQPSDQDVQEFELALRDLERATFGSETASEHRARLKAEIALADLEEEMAHLEEKVAEDALKELYVGRRKVLVRKHNRRSQTFK